MRPLFLVGVDPRSLQWLRRNRKRLQKIEATGLIVQARTSEDLDAVAGLANGLALIPASGSDIARLVGIKHYPVLITSKGIGP